MPRTGARCVGWAIVVVCFSLGSVNCGAEIFPSANAQVSTAQRAISRDNPCSSSRRLASRASVISIGTELDRL